MFLILIACFFDDREASTSFFRKAYTKTFLSYQVTEWNVSLSNFVKFGALWLGLFPFKDSMRTKHILSQSGNKQQKVRLFYYFT